MAYTPNTNTVDNIATGNLTALNSTVTLVTGGNGTGIFEVSGTWVGTITFEGSNNAFTTSQAVTAIYLGGIQTQAATTTTNGFFSVITAGFAQVRAKMTSYTSGTAAITANGSQADRIVVPLQGNPNNNQTLATLNTGANAIGSITNTAFTANAGTNLNTSALALDSTVAKDATLTGGTQQTKITDGTSIVNVLKSDGTYAGQNAQLVGGARLAVSYSTAINAAVASTDAGNYQWVSVQITSVGTTATQTFQISNDNTNWVGISLAWASNYSNTPIANSGGGAGIYHGAITARYFRINVTGITGGTAAGVVHFTSVPAAFMGVAVSGTSQVNLNSVSGIGGAAITDAFAGPNVPPISSLDSVYNGTTWDRIRNNWNVNTGDTGAKTVSVAGATQTNYNSRGATILINMGAVTGTTPTLTAQVQGSADGGTTWYNIPGAVTPSITATGTTLLTVYPSATVAANAAVSYPLPRTWRLNYTIGGTTPSFTITNVQVAYTL